MSNRKKIICLMLVFSLVMALCIPSAYAGRDVKGKSFYTKVNIWYEMPEEILSTNYHRGIIIPVGTKVTVKKVKSREIQFSVDETGQDFKIVLVRKHMSRGTDEWDYFDRHFSEKNPLSKGGSFSKFSEMEKRNIKIGKVEKGMSKDAVLMAYGYPPGHRTPSIEHDRWVYWSSRFVNRAIVFQKGRVISTR